VLPVELDLAASKEKRPPSAFPGARLLADVTRQTGSGMRTVAPLTSS
jgi:hypothetical protein